MAADLYKYFRLEARELLDQFAQGVLALERGEPVGPLVQRLLRVAHTLKGAARVVKQTEIADRAHAIEDTLTPHREGEASLARAEIDAVLSHLDGIGRALAALTPAEAPRPVPSTEPRPAVEEPSRTIRADLAEMDAVLDGVAETHMLLNGLRGAADGLEQAQHLADVLLAQLAPSRQGMAAMTPGGLFAIAEELRRKFTAVERGLAATVDQMDRELQQLRDAAEQLRLMPAQSLFAALERTARDSASTLGRQVEFKSAGGDLKLDSHLLGMIQGALVQIVRNAVAHGIEPPAARRQAGKPEAGRIEVTISQRGRRILFECRDDGAGLDLDAIRRIAGERGLAGAEAARLGPERLVELLLRGGITTAREVTEMSGRGVGLDIVRAALERLGGEIGVETEPGIGTRFTLSVPRTLAAMEVLVVEPDETGIGVALPLDFVRATLRIGAEEITPASPGTAILFGDRAIPFIALSTALEGARRPSRHSWTVIVLAGPDGLAAVGVERLRGTGTLVVRPLPAELPATSTVTGIALDAEGNPQLVLDANGIIAAARRGDSPPEVPSARRPILVIDDSMTTRMLEQSILESAGYEVDVALSGEEALEIARRKRYALFLVDVEMPGIDGFTFIERIRADPALHRIPAILVTSRASPEDLQRGRDVGAQGHIAKSEFDQVKLLDLIRPLVE
ncbi:MAG TPA: response regulator [Aliidongia sp.]|nr:response regulator [Aliidongia sp.]